MSGHDLNDDPFEAIAPLPVAVDFAGRRVEITPLTMGKLPSFARAIRPFAHKLADVQSLAVADILDLLADHGEAMLDAISIATGIKRHELDAGDPMAVVSLIAPIIKVNADFFGRRLGPIARAALATPAPSGDGLTAFKP